MKQLNQELNLKELSMGMSADYLTAVEYGATYLRIGSNIFELETNLLLFLFYY